ncbi:MAG: MotA/TolQ/ExbB proton channel family protein [Planctomycetaceae bacterium]|nr:MotA/TolQ/ExbB proton channel family protein [Planctomycetaceae bacterium]
MLSVLFAQVAEKVEKAAGKAAEKAGEVATKAAEQATAAADKAGQAADAAATAATQTSPAWYEELLKSGAMGYMIDGGIFMWPILFLGVLAFGVIIERYRTLQMLNIDSEPLRRKVLELLQADRVEEALQHCDQAQGPVPAILGAGLRKFLVLRRLDYDAAEIESQVEKAMDDYGVHISAALENHLPILATVSSVAPMIGFLGTVQGMVISFADIVAKKGQMDIVEAAAGGIMTALLTTVLGLVVGIPAFTAFNYFTSIINRFVLDVEESATELIEGVTLQIALEAKASAETTSAS